MNRRRLILAASALAAGARLPAYANARASVVGEAINLPSVTLIDGRAITTDVWRGKVLLVVKFATWCPFRKIVNPKVEKLLPANRARGLEVLALSIDRNPAEVPKYIQQHRYSFHAAMWTPEWEATLGSQKGLPVFWVIGRDGKLKQTETGELLDEDVAEFARWL